MTFERGQYANHNQSGGYAYMDAKGKIHQNLKCYEPSIIKQWYRKIKGKILDKLYRAQLLKKEEFEFFEANLKFNADDSIEL